ncbi:hypothetical protein GGI16_003536, partial [Coemansia sp. S142-1]
MTERLDIEPQFIFVGLATELYEFIDNARGNIHELLIKMSTKTDVSPPTSISSLGSLMQVGLQ